MLASHHFRNSKRYPALLKYVVNKTLDGQAGELKERTLGIEVFDRAADYDTNSDPVVRFSASEVRKRIAQFYREGRRESLVEIDLPLGSYVPEFRIRPAVTGHGAQVAEDLSSEEDADAANDSSHRAAPTSEVGYGQAGRRGFMRAVPWLAAVLAVIATGGLELHRIHAQPISEKLCRPLLKTPGSVQIVMGNGQHEVRTPPDPEHEIVASQLHGAYNRVSVCDAVAVSRLASMLGNQSKPYEVKEADLTNLQDLRQRPVILIGAYNNLWTMRLMEPLRYHFVKDGHGVKIVDTKDPQNVNWSVDYSKPNSSTVSDYAIIARYTDATTGGSILIIAGIGAYGTQAASEAVTTPADLQRLTTRLPRGWQNSNLELIVKTTIIHGEAGPAEYVTSATW